jgi:hypothetical protein
MVVVQLAGVLHDDPDAAAEGEIVDQESDLHAPIVR